MKEKGWGGWERWSLRSVWVRGLLFAAVLACAGWYGRPWGLGWLRPDEAVEIAENFLLHQGAELDKYTLLRATEYRRNGEWSRMEANPVDVGDPAVGYVLRYFADSTLDGWTVGVSPAGHIYRVVREQYEDEPGMALDRGLALALTETKMAADLGLPIERLVLVEDSLVVRPQRNDWGFVFAVAPQPPYSPDDSPGIVRVELSGDALTGFTISDVPDHFSLFPRIGGRYEGEGPQRAGSDRVLGFAIVLIGVLIIWQFHKAPLATHDAGVWGGTAFVLILLVRGLTFPQSVLLMPTDIPYAGYLSRIALSAVVDALQAAILMGLIVASGDSVMRDHLRKSTTITRLGRGIRSWPHAWGNAARWALVAAAGLIIFETVTLRFVGPIGLYSKLPPIIAGSLSSPLPAVALPVQIAHDVISDEGLYRLWLLPFTLLFFRPWLGILVSAGIVTYWVGFNPAQITVPACIAYILWNTIAGVLVAGSGILAAALFHLFVLVGFAAITVYWIGFDGASFGTMCGILLGVIALIGWKELRDESRHWKDSTSSTSTG